jgi:hypothetical protein
MIPRELFRKTPDHIPFAEGKCWGPHSRVEPSIVLQACSMLMSIIIEYFVHLYKPNNNNKWSSFPHTQFHFTLSMNGPRARKWLSYVSTIVANPATLAPHHRSPTVSQGFDVGNPGFISRTANPFLYYHCIS